MFVFQYSSQLDASVPSPITQHIHLLKEIKVQIIIWRVTYYYTLNTDFLHVSGSFTLYKMLYQYINLLNTIIFSPI